MGILDIFGRKRKEETIQDTSNVKNKEEMYYGRAAIFCAEEDMNKIMNVICDTFGISSSESGNTLELRNGDINIFVNVVTDDMGDEAKVYVKDQMDRTYGHFYAVETDT